MDAPTGRPEQFIVSGPPVFVAAVALLATRDSEIDLVSVSGAPGAPERAVVTMPAARADLLRRAFGGQLLVEADELLDIDPPPLPD
jgi:hypothetical protein